MPLAESLLVSGRVHRIVRKIGRGTFGDVYLTRDDEGKEYAIKILSIQPIPSQVAAFKNEFLLLAQLKHPFLCNVHDFVYSELLENYLFISDYAEGQSFFEATEGKSPEEIEDLALQVLEVLDYLHVHEVIHFDIKCPNILVRDNGSVVLLDFGFAHLQGGPLTKFPGSLRYAAPEILKRSPSTNHRADLYSFGMVLFRALTRHFPFRDDDPSQMIEWHLSKTPTWSEEESRRIPLHLRRLTEFLLKKNPAERFSRARSAINWIRIHSTGLVGPPVFLPSRLLPKEGSLVAREKELALVTETLTSPSGQAFVFVGERGIGKTRLLREIKYTAEVKELHCLWFDHFSERGGIFQLTQQLALPPFKSPDEFFRLSSNEIWKGAPLLVFVDDLQDADPFFWEWLARLTRERIASSLFLTWEGPLPTSGPLLTLFQQARVLPLAPFSREELKTYLSEISPEEETTLSWLEPLYEFSSGIPLLVHEGLRYLMGNQGKRILPSSIRDIYKNTLTTLSDEAVEILETASLWKRAVTLEELSKTAPLELDRLIPQIHQLVSKGLLSRVTSFQDLESRYRVANEALRLVLQEGQGGKTQEERFGRLLSTLEEKGEGPLEELASYASACGDSKKASHYLSRLGEGYEAAFQTQKAIEAYRRLLPFEKGARGKLIPLLVLAGKPDEALALFPDEERLTLTDRKLKGWVLTRSGRFKEAEELFQGGIAESGAEDPLHRELLNDLANVYLQTAETDKALRLFQQTLPAPSLSEADKRKTLKNNNLGLALALSGRFEEALRFEGERLNLFKKEGDEHQIASSLSQLGFIALKGQNLSEAQSYFEEALALSEKTGDLHNILILLDNLILISQRRALYHEAIRYFSKAVNYRTAVSPAYQLAQNYLKGAFLYLSMGLAEPAGAHLEKIESLVENPSSPGLKGWTALAWGYYHRAMGRPEDAASHFRKAIELADPKKESTLLAWGHYALADLHLQGGQFAEARQECDCALRETSGVADEELKFRIELLSRLLEKNQEALKRLGQESESRGFLEIAAEAYEAAHHPRGKEILLEIASRLPEEYRIAYKNDRGI